MRVPTIDASCVAAAGLSLAAMCASACRGADPAELGDVPAPVPSAPAPPQSATSPPPWADEPLAPLPAPFAVDARRSALGEKLFGDASLSADGTVSCATCHPLERGGADGLAHSRGANSKETALNTPTIFNSAYNARFNWNGAYVTIEDEFDAPVARTMGTTFEAIDDKLRASPAMRDAFAAAYPAGVTTAAVKNALASYVKTLVTPGARFDAWLRGDSDALSADERRGYALFKDLGCASCHQGAMVGGNAFERIGVMRDYFLDRGGPPPTQAELGRFNATQDPADRHVFRVPSLRNVAVTPPYFHDGSAATLEQAIETMGHVQLGREIDQEHVELVAAFLRTLTGEYRGRPL